MKNAKLLTLSCLLTALVGPVSSNCEEFLLYVPKPDTGKQAPASPEEGVLVKRVTVKRGDTLSLLSRKHIGAASYFPQLLVFNSIKNPDRISIGESILIPVQAGRKPWMKKSTKSSKVSKRAKGRRHHASRRSAPLAGATVQQAQPAEMQSMRSAEQQSYQRARRAYQAGDYQKAQELFSGFLAKFPNSDLAADASLYQADCFLHLSGM